MKRLPRDLEQQIMAQATAVGRTAGEALSAPPPVEPKKRKYRNTKVEHDGLKFDSKLELNRYLHLKTLEAGGVIAGLRFQVKYRIEVNGSLVCHYTADFVYLLDGEQVIEDTKSQRTTVFNLKKRLMRAALGLDIIVVETPNRGVGP